MEYTMMILNLWAALAALFAVLHYTATKEAGHE